MQEQKKYNLADSNIRKHFVTYKQAAELYSMGLKDLEAMVKEVNATQVAPADKLTDSVYHYDSQVKIFELGEKFVVRQAEKEAEHAEEKGEKSVLGDLKAKKEEVAKTPKVFRLET